MATTFLIWQASVSTAMSRLAEPNEAEASAVDARQELDLKLGAATTTEHQPCPAAPQQQQGVSHTQLRHNNSDVAPDAPHAPRRRRVTLAGPSSPLHSVAFSAVSEATTFLIW